MSRFTLKLTSLKFISAVDAGAQGEISNVALLKRHDANGIEAICQVVKIDASLGLVFGWALASSLDGGKTQHVDLQGDAIQNDDLIKVAAEFMQDAAASDVMHDDKLDGRIVFAMPLVPEINAALGIHSDVHGLAIAMKPSPETFKRFQSGELKAFSIAGTGERAPLVEKASVAKGIAEARELLKAAIARHERHMSGSEPTDDASQMKLMDEMKAALAELVVEKVAPGSIATANVAARLASESPRMRAPVRKDSIMTLEEALAKIAELEAKLADLDKSKDDLEEVKDEAEKRATLTDAQRAYHKSLDKADAKAFLAKSFIQRESVIAEIEKSNEVVYTSKSTGETFRKSDDARVVTMAKRQDELAAELAKRDESIEKAEIATLAKSTLGNLGGSDEVHQLIVKSLRKSGAPQVEIDAAITAMKGWHVLAKASAVAKGAGGVADPTDDSPTAQLEALAKVYATENKVDISKARGLVLNTAEGAALYGEIEKRKQNSRTGATA